MLRVLVADPKTTLRGLAEAGRQRSFGRRTVQPKSLNQRRYLDAIESHDMVFGIGPAGTGKTYLAVAMAISALISKRVNRIILARPAVEAGERLGVLPGTLQEMIDTYPRSRYAAFDEADVVRHRLVQRIIRAYDEHKTRVADEQMELLDAKNAANRNGVSAAEQTGTAVGQEQE